MNYGRSSWGQVINVIWEQLVAAMHAADTRHELSESRRSTWTYFSTGLERWAARLQLPISISDIINFSSPGAGNLPINIHKCEVFNRLQNQSHITNPYSTSGYSLIHMIFTVTWALDSGFYVVNKGGHEPFGPTFGFGFLAVLQTTVVYESG